MLLVNEVFASIQGEGLQTGRPAFFVRLQGCPIQCAFCDTQYAQHQDQKWRLSDNDNSIIKKEHPSKEFAAFDETFLLRELEKTKKDSLLVITGGEPCLQDLTKLTNNAESLGYPTQIETSGAYPIHASNKTWITLSPKKKSVLEENWIKANEIKFVIAKEDDLSPYTSILDRLGDKPICLQPLSCDKNATALCIHLCQERNWHFSLQTHKYIGLR